MLLNLKYILSILFASFFIACFSAAGEKSQSNNVIFSDIPENLTQYEKDALIKNREYKKVWEKKNIQNYDLRFQKNQGGLYYLGDPVIIKIRDGKFDALENISGGKSVLMRRLYEEYVPMVKLFELIESEIKSQKGSVEIQYDSALNYPKLVRFQSKTAVADGNYIIEINKLEIIE